MLRRTVSNLTSRLWRPEWVCPRCGRPFANANQSHSCGRHTVRAFLERRTPQAIALYRRFASLVRRCGPVAIVPTQTRIGFQVRGIFASINKLDDGHLDAHVVLGRKLESRRFTRIQSLSLQNHVHHFRVRSPEELDDEVARWLAEAYMLKRFS